MSPMKKIHESGMRLPKQTKLMFKNMENMRKGSHRSPNEILSRRTLTEQPLDEGFNGDQFSKSTSNAGGVFKPAIEAAYLSINKQ